MTSIPVTEELKSENSELKDQNFQLLEQVEDLIAANQTFRDTVQVLEEKISKIEKAAFKEYEEKKHEVTMLKTALKKQEGDVLGVKKDLNLSKKVVKEKEKEIYRTEQKNENLADNIKRLKSELGTLKVENKKLLKKKSLKVTETSSLPVNRSDDIHCSPLSESFVSGSSNSSSIMSSKKPLVIDEVNHPSLMINNNTCSSASIIPFPTTTIDSFHTASMLTNSLGTSKQISLVSDCSVSPPRPKDNSPSNSCGTPPLATLTCSPRPPIETPLEKSLRSILEQMEKTTEEIIKNVTGKTEVDQNESH